MSKYTNSLFRILASIIAFIFMLGLLLSIAYFHELYTLPTSEESTLLVITNATLIDGTGAEPQPGTTIIVSGDYILSIRQGGVIGDTSEVIDADGGFVIPALVDGALFFEARVGSEVDYMSGEWVWEVTRSLPEHRRGLLNAGVTTVQDLGSGLQSILNTRSLVQKGDLAGPRLFTSGPILTVQDGFPPRDLYPGRWEEVSHPIDPSTDPVDVLQALAARGVNLISLVVTGENHGTGASAKLIANFCALVGDYGVRISIERDCGCCRIFRHHFNSLCNGNIIPRNINFSVSSN